MTGTKEQWRVLARHKNWVVGATITESIRGDDTTENGLSIRRFTATIRGWRNWKIYEIGKDPSVSSIVTHVKEVVRNIRDRIDNGDNTVFNQERT